MSDEFKVPDDWKRANDAEIVKRIERNNEPRDLYPIPVKRKRAADMTPREREEFRKAALAEQQKNEYITAARKCAEARKNCGNAELKSVLYDAQLALYRAAKKC